MPIYYFFTTPTTLSDESSITCDLSIFSCDEDKAKRNHDVVLKYKFENIVLPMIVNITAAPNAGTKYACIKFQMENCLIYSMSDSSTSFHEQIIPENYIDYVNSSTNQNDIRYLGWNYDSSLSNTITPFPKHPRVHRDEYFRRSFDGVIFFILFLVTVKLGYIWIRSVSKRFTFLSNHHQQQTEISSITNDLMLDNYLLTDGTTDELFLQTLAELPGM